MEFPIAYEENSNGRQYDGAAQIAPGAYKAVYRHDAVNPGNLFIEALPRPRTIEEIKKDVVRLGYIPNDADRKRPAYEQIAQASCIKKLRFVLPMQYQFEEQAYLAMRDAYSHRRLVGGIGTMIPVTMDDRNGSEGLRSEKDLGDVPVGFTLIGYSGCGKSTTVGATLAGIPRRIVHEFPNGRHVQIPCLVVECPPHSSMMGVFASFGESLDEALGNTVPVYAKMLEAKGTSRGLTNHRDKVCELILRFSVGLIIIEEAQNLNFSEGNANSFESLLTICNKTKVALAVIGTERTARKIHPNVQISRRLGYEMRADSYCSYRAFFDDLVSKFAPYQWFDEPVTITQDMKDALFEVTHGVIGLLSAVWFYIQEAYINAHTKPVVDADFIRRIALDRSRQLQEAFADELKEQAEAEKKKGVIAETRAVMKQLDSGKESGIVRPDKVSAAIGKSADGSVAVLFDDVLRSIREIDPDATVDEVSWQFTEAVSSDEFKNGAISIEQLRMIVYGKVVKARSSSRRRKPVVRATDGKAKDADFSEEEKRLRENLLSNRTLIPVEGLSGNAGEDAV